MDIGRGLAAAVTIGLLVLSGGCGDPAPRPDTEATEATAAPKPAATAAGPRIVFETTSHDFGRISDVTSHEYSFAFHNAGDAPLVVSEVKPNCGCTVTTLAKDTFAPGESASIDVRFDPVGHGRQRKRITVVSNSTDAPTTVLGIAAEIVPLAWAEPDRYLRLGPLAYRQEHTAMFTVRSMDPDLVVHRVRSSSPHLRPELLPEVEGEPRQVRVTIPATVPWGPMGGRVLVDVSARPFADQPTVHHEVEVYVNAQLYGAVSITENPFLVGRVAPGAAFSRTTTISRTDGGTFTITNARVEAQQFDGAAVRVEPVDGASPSASWNVTVYGSAGSYLGLVRGAVVLYTDLPGDEGEMRLKYMGTVRADG